MIFLKRAYNRTRQVNTREGNARKPVRLTDNRLNQLETLGRLLSPALHKDFVGSLVARVVGAAEVLRRVSEDRAAHLSIISVPDAESLKEFLKNARKAYRKHHPSGKRGPKFAEVDALVWIARLEHKLKRQPTRKEIIAGITDKDRYGSIPVSIRTAEKIAQLYRLLTRYSWYGRTGQALSKEDVQWLRKNLTPNQRSSINWWTQQLKQWQHTKLEAAGLGKAIRDVFTLSSAELTEEGKRLEALRHQRTFGKQ